MTTHKADRRWDDRPLFCPSHTKEQLLKKNTTRNPIGVFSCLTTSRAAFGAPVNQLFPNEGLVLEEGPNQRGKGGGPEGLSWALQVDCFHSRGSDLIAIVGAVTQPEGLEEVGNLQERQDRDSAAIVWALCCLSK
ncbi:unnamed protein product [Arctogadus glacialis]